LKAATLSHKRLIPALIIAVAILGIIFIVMDRSEIEKVLGQASWRPLPFALMATFVSYFCISFSFARVSKSLGIQMKLMDLTAVGFVTTVLNHVLTSGGTAGYSVRYMLMNRHSVGMKDVLAASILHFYLTSLAMVGMLPVGLIYLLLHSSISRGLAILLAVLALLDLLAAVFASSLVFLSTMRKRVLAGLTKAARRLIHRDLEPTLERFDATMTQGVEFMRHHPSTLILIMMLIVIDWACSALTLWFCFGALGTDVTLGELITGFVIGTVAGVISMIPGGLGVQEGSMAGIFALLGVSFEHAVLASILFRVVYFMIPYIFSLGFYWWLLRRKGQKPDLEQREVEHAHSDA
jgi:uncharacterized protein (TIRG00374 family)